MYREEEEKLSLRDRTIKTKKDTERFSSLTKVITCAFQFLPFKCCRIIIPFGIIARFSFAM